MKIIQKVLIYITHRDWLLVFRHPFAPEAGIQVPAGSVHINESPEEAALREALEETGLVNLSFDALLGVQERDMSDFKHNEIHHRRFYHLRCKETPPTTWLHEESDPSDGLEELPIIFEFFWIHLPDGVPPLIADHDLMLPQLLRRL